MAKRRRALRILAAIAALGAVAIVANAVWISILARRFESRVEALRDAGAPTLLADFVEEPVPADQNAAVVLRRANEWYMAHLAEEEPNPWDDVDQAWLDRSGPYQRLLQAARKMPYTQWNANDMESANVLGNACRYLDWRAQGPETPIGDRLECVASILDFAERVQTRYAVLPALIEYTLDSVAAAAAESIAARPGFDAVTARRLLGPRFDRADQKNRVPQSLQGTRVLALDLSRDWLSGRTPAGSTLPEVRFGATWPGRSWVYRDALGVLDMFERIEALLGRPFAAAYPEAIALGDEIYEMSAFRCVTRGFHNLPTSAVGGKARHKATMRVARVALALLQRRQETGEWPRELSEVASLLDGGIPLDPFTGKQLIYEPGQRVAADTPRSLLQDDRFDPEWRFAN